MSLCSLWALAALWETCQQCCLGLRGEHVRARRKEKGRSCGMDFHRPSQLLKVSEDDSKVV